MCKIINSFLFPSVFATLLAFAAPTCFALGTNEVKKVTIQELLQNRQQWKGKKVEVVGFHICLFEVSALYEDESSAKGARDGRSLWIDRFDKAPGAKDSSKWTKKGFVRIIGTFEFGEGYGSGHLGQWPAKLKQIELIEPFTEATKSRSKP
jgi:hypothetical protein